MPKRIPRTRIVKKGKLLRLTLESIRRLKVAAQKAGMSENVYTETALKAQFKKDGIPEQGE
jgi:hypothetical protein